MGGYHFVWRVVKRHQSETHPPCRFPLAQQYIHTESRIRIHTESRIRKSGAPTCCTFTALHHSVNGVLFKKERSFTIRGIRSKAQAMSAVSADLDLPEQGCHGTQLKVMASLWGLGLKLTFPDNQNAEVEGSPVSTPKHASLAEHSGFAFPSQRAHVAHVAHVAWIIPQLQDSIGKGVSRLARCQYVSRST